MYVNQIMKHERRQEAGSRWPGTAGYRHSHLQPTGISLDAVLQPTCFCGIQTLYWSHGLVHHNGSSNALRAPLQPWSEDSLGLLSEGTRPAVSWSRSHSNRSSSGRVAAATITAVAVATTVTVKETVVGELWVMLSKNNDILCRMRDSGWLAIIKRGLGPTLVTSQLTKLDGLNMRTNPEGGRDCTTMGHSPWSPFVSKNDLIPDWLIGRKGWQWHVVWQ